MRIVLSLLALAAIAGCAPPRPIAGEFPTIYPAQVQQGGFVGERVRWGGVIVETKPGPEETCMEIVVLPLGRRARPRVDAESFGRAHVCAPAFYDPKVYEPEREVTVVGTLRGVERGKVDDQEYDFPRVEADAVYLWPERRRREPDYGYGPYAYPYGYDYPYSPYYPYYYYPYGYGYPYWGWGWYGGGWRGGGWHGGHGHDDWHGGGHGQGGGHGHGGGHGYGGGHGHGGGRH